MATANTIFSFKMAPNSIPTSPFKQKTITMNLSLSWVSARTKIRRSHFPYFSLYYIERQKLEDCCSCCSVLACLPSFSHSSFGYTFKKTKLYVSGLSFRTTEESLRNPFQNFGQLADVNLVMDKIAKRPRGFAFLRYETEEEAQKAFEGMHGKFLDGTVIFVEVAKPRSIGASPKP